MATPTIFISYSHKDEAWKDQVALYLGGLNLPVEVWDDRRIGASQDWQAEINGAIEGAAVAVLLVTANFLISKFIQEEEVPRLLARQQAGLLAIAPVIVLPCGWKRFQWLAKIQVRPKDGRALALRKDGNPASEPEIANDLTSIADEVAELMDKAGAAAPVTVPVIAAAPESQPVPVAAGAELTAVADSATQTEAAVREVTAAATDLVTGNLLAEFESAFRETAKTIACITGYKELHDELHTLELDIFAGIQNEHTRVSSDADARERLGFHASELFDTVHQVRALAQGLPVLPGGLGWIDKLERAHKLLLEAVAGQSSARATSAVTLLNGVLDAQPGLLNEQIVAHTRELDFGPVQKAVAAVQQQLAARTGAAPPRVQELQGTADAILRLEGDFRAVVNKHNAWQQIEHTLRTIETTIASSFEQLEFLWPSLRDEVRPLFSPPAEQWEHDLCGACDALDGSLAARDPMRAGEARKRFRQFRRLSGIHFLKVDEELRDACGRLGRVGESIQLLLRLLDTL